jgi:hypothetical protein
LSIFVTAISQLVCYIWDILYIEVRYQLLAPAALLQAKEFAEKARSCVDPGAGLKSLVKKIMLFS